MLGGIVVRLPSVLGGGAVTILLTLKLVNVKMKKKKLTKWIAKRQWLMHFKLNWCFFPLTNQAQGALTCTYSSLYVHYSSRKEEEIWCAEWGRKIFFNHCTKHTKSVVILFDPKLHVTVEKEIKHESGRALVLKICID